MIVYTIRYHTENTYDSPVYEAYLNFLVIPLETEDQHCSGLIITNNLLALPQYSESLYGAKAILYRLIGPFSAFRLTMEIRVEKEEWVFPVLKSLTIEEEQKVLHDDYFKLKNEDYIIHTKLTDAGNIVLPQETSLLPNETVFMYTQRMNAFVQRFLVYQPNITTPHTTVREIVELRKGVCQDYAHLFIAIMRLNFIPVRYVSGYLNQGRDFIGAAAMHAWVEVFIPETGWIGIDPTNNLFVNEHYIKVAHGSDYLDCMPVKGVYRSDGGGTTMYKVNILEQHHHQ